MAKGFRPLTTALHQGATSGQWRVIVTLYALSLSTALGMPARPLLSDMLVREDKSHM